MGGDYESYSPATAKTLEHQSPPAAQLFVAVNDQDCGGTQAAVVPQVQRQPTLAIVERDENRALAGALDGGRKDGQQGRLARTVATDDFSPPAGLP